MKTDDYDSEFDPSSYFKTDPRLYNDPYYEKFARGVTNCVIDCVMQYGIEKESCDFDVLSYETYYKITQWLTTNWKKWAEEGLLDYNDDIEEDFNNLIPF